MSDDNTSEQGFTGHFTMQMVGASIGWAFFKMLDVYGIHAAAGDESLSGTFFGSSMMAIWWLLGPRIKRWRDRE
jgi:hypothetical protein